MNAIYSAVPPETTLLDAIKHGPSPYFLAFIVALAALALGVAALVALGQSRKGARLAALAGLGVSACVIAIGTLGWYAGMIEVDAVVGTPGLSTSDVANIRALGGREALLALYFGVAAAILPALVCGVALVASMTKQTDPTPGM